MKDILHNFKLTEIEILTVLEIESKFKFSNIQSMNKFIIPLENNPIKSSLKIIGAIAVSVLIVFLIIKLLKTTNAN